MDKGDHMATAFPCFSSIFGDEVVVVQGSCSRLLPRGRGRCPTLVRDSNLTVNPLTVPRTDPDFRDSIQSTAHCARMKNVEIQESFPRSVQYNLRDSDMMFSCLETKR